MPDGLWGVFEGALGSRVTVCLGEPTDKCDGKGRVIISHENHFLPLLLSSSIFLTQQPQTSRIPS